MGIGVRLTVRGDGVLSAHRPPRPRQDRLKPGAAPGSAARLVTGKHHATLIAAVALALALALAAVPAAAERPLPQSINTLINKPAPELRTRRISGTTPLDLAALRGKPVLLIFFATWCTSCERLEPVLEALAAELAPRGLAVIALSHERRARLVADVRKPPVAYTVAQCTGRTALRYAARAVPTLVLIDGDAIVRRAWQGPTVDDLPAIRRAIEPMLPAAATRRSGQPSK